VADPIFDHLEETIRGTATPAALLEAASYLWRPSVPFRIRRTADGVAMLCEVARGSSTACLDAVAWWRDGSTGFLCGDPGWRRPDGTDYVRPGAAWLERAGDELEAVAIRENREPVRMRLPGGAVRLDVRFGPDGVDLEVPRPPAPAPPPAPPEPGAPPPRAPRRRGGLCGWLRRRLRR
jgi:hypothetical protein